MQLRDYQYEVSDAVDAEWAAGANDVALVLPTGAGKTVTFAHKLHEHKGLSVAVAHRRELVGQIAMALARESVPHRIVAPTDVVKLCVADQVRELGRTTYSPSARCAVAGVDTLNARKKELQSWASQVTLWVQDECHHVQPQNKWGYARAMFENAKGLGVTATLCRADGRGFRGVFQSIVIGPHMRRLINRGYLTDYEVYCPDSHIKLDDVPVGDSGDFVQRRLVAAVEDSTLVGDIVDTYRRYVLGKLAIVFAVSVEEAEKIARRFVAAGVPAVCLDATTEARARADTIRRFRRREVLVLVNVDLFGEGFDVPGVEVVHMGRPTESFNVFAQEWGRMMRPIYADGHDLSTDEGRVAAIAASYKPRGIIFDHVGNLIRHHGPPDKLRLITLDARERGSRGSRPIDDVPMRICVGTQERPGCTRPFERALAVCPYCGAPVPAPSGARTIEQVDGDLSRVDPELLRQMRGEVARVDEDAREVGRRMERAGMPAAAVHGQMAQHRARQEAQDVLRRTIAWWAGAQRCGTEEAQRRFFLAFNIDVMSAQALGRPEALALAERINGRIGRESMR